MQKETIEIIFIIVQGASTLILAVLTFFYLMEVAKTRKMTSRVLELEWTTDIGVDLTTSPHVPDLTSKKIHIPYNLTISSVGKLPVNLLGGQLVISLGQETTTHEIKSVEKLGASTRQSFTFSFSRTETEIAQASNLDTNTVIEWESPLPEVGAKIKLRYKDGLSGEVREKSFEYKYKFNQWQNT